MNLKLKELHKVIFIEFLNIKECSYKIFEEITIVSQ